MIDLCEFYLDRTVYLKRNNNGEKAPDTLDKKYTGQTQLCIVHEQLFPGTGAASPAPGLEHVVWIVPEFYLPLPTSLGDLQNRARDPGLERFITMIDTL